LASWTVIVAEVISYVDPDCEMLTVPVTSPVRATASCAEL